MKRKKFSGKRLISAVLTAAMMLSLVPAAAFAANEDEGEWSVPVRMMHATKEGQASMGDKAIDGNAKVTIKDGKSVYEVNFKGIEFTGLYGHLLKLWHYPDYAADRDSITGTVAAKPSNKYQDKNLNGEMASFYKTFTMTRDGAQKEKEFFIRISVDAMQVDGDFFDQDARLVFDWDNAKKLGDEQKPDPKPTEKNFVDVHANDWFYQPVIWAVDKGITSGVDATHFGPAKACTREQAVTFIWRAVGSPEPKTTSNPFVDVKSNDYFYKAVLWAVENKVTSGVSATQFGAGSTCDRSQIVTFLYRANGEPEVTVNNSFSDVAPNAYYAKAVQWAVDNKITNGLSATSFGPASPCTRGQIVTFLFNAYK